MDDLDRARWLADKIGALGDYAKEAADVLRRQASELAEHRRKASLPDPLGEALNSGDGVYRP